MEGAGCCWDLRAFPRLRLYIECVPARPAEPGSPAQRIKLSRSKSISWISCPPPCGFAAFVGQLGITGAAPVVARSGSVHYNGRAGRLSGLPLQALALHRSPAAV